MPFCPAIVSSSPSGPWTIATCGMREAMKTPRSFVASWRWNPVCVSRRTTVAPGTAVPDGSVTVPRMIPVVACDWAVRRTGNARANTTGPRSLRTMLRPPTGWGRYFGAASVPRELRDRKKGKELIFSMQNAEIARLLGEVADLLEISAGNPFKVRAYRNAARTVADHPDPIAELVAGGEFDLTDLAGIGDGMAKEITALVQTGTLPTRQQLMATVPPGLLDLLRISGLGPKRVKLFHDRLKVNSIADLKDALEKGKIAKRSEEHTSE